MEIGIGLIIILLALNSLFSMSRAALVNASRGQLRQMAESGDGAAVLALRVAEDATKLLATLRFAQTFCRFGIAGLSAIILTPRLEALLGGWLALDLQTQSIIFFVLWLFGTVLIVNAGEFLPEALILRAPEQAALTFAPFVAFIEWLLAPVVQFSLWLSGRVSSPVAGQRVPLVTEEEIKTLVDAGEEGGAIEEDEKDMIYSIFEISDTWARELMVPRIDVLALDVETPVTDAVDAMLSAGHSRVPVYEHSIDNVLGILYTKDLLRAYRASKTEGGLRPLLRPTYFVPETKKANELLAELQQKRIHMAVVVDEYGGTSGLVTLEDIVEEIVGDIRDEYDVNEESYVEQLSETEYIFDARINLGDVNELLKLKLATDDSDSLGGFIYSQLGHIPANGEKVPTTGAQFEVLVVTGRRIRKVRAVLTREDSAMPPTAHHAEELENGRKPGATKPLPQLEGNSHE